MQNYRRRINGWNWRKKSAQPGILREREQKLRCIAGNGRSGGSFNGNVKLDIGF